MQSSKLQFRVQNFLAIWLVVFIFFIASPIFAAEVSFESKTQTIAIDQQFEVGVFINASDGSINAIEGKIIFPQDLLEIKKINDGNSIINFWIEKPKNVSEGQITFSGIIPGGYSDSRGLIFSITFLAKKDGASSIEFRDIKALLNDGKGTEAPLTISNFQFLVTEQISSPQVTVPLIEDRNPPEEFIPQIAADPVIFDGKWFLVFATQDKGSGIDYYEVCEGKRKCVIADSPYLLQNQDLEEKIAVKAVDKSGNKRVATLPPQKPRAWYKNYSLFVILVIAAVVFAYLMWKLLWRKRKK